MRKEKFYPTRSQEFSFREFHPSPFAFQKKGEGFTLIEILVAIAIIGLLASIILISVKPARERARIAKGLNFASQVHHALGADAVGIWDFDCQTLNDSSGNGNDATCSICPEFTQNTPGNKGCSLKFSSNQYLDLANLPVDGASAGAKNTVEFWMYWKGENSQMPFGWKTAYDLWFRDNCFGFNTGQSNVFGIHSSGLKNRWVHVVAVFYNGVPSSDESALYIDGIKQDIFACLGTTNISRNVTSEARVSGWAYSGGYRFSGFIDNFHIYSEPLSTAQIKKLYVEGAKEKGLLAEELTETGSP